MKILKLIGWIALGLALAAAFALILGLAVMWLWNWLMPDLFGLPAVDYWQAVGLLLLSHLLLRGPSFAHRRHPRREPGRDDERYREFRRRFRGAIGFPQVETDHRPTSEGEPG